MKNSFLKSFVLFTIISLGLMVIIEWMINKNIEIAHVIGWVFVATFIGALIGISRQKHTH